MSQPEKEKDMMTLQVHRCQTCGRCAACGVEITAAHRASTRDTGHSDTGGGCDAIDYLIRDTITGDNISGWFQSQEAAEHWLAITGLQ